MADFVTFGETPLRLSPPGSKRVEMADSLDVYVDGTESNVAVAAAGLGSDALWVSKVQDTAVGRNVVRQIEATGLNTSIAWTTDNVRQGITFRETGAAPRASQCWHDRTHTAFATAKPGDLPVETIQQARLVYTGLSSAVLSTQAAETTEALLRASGGSGAVTAVELDYEPELADAETYKETFTQLSDEVDVLITSEDAIPTVLGERGSPRELTNVLAALYSLQIVVVRRTDGSAIVLQDSPGTNVIHERTMVDTETVDPMGEQGAFTGTFLHELVQGADSARALTRAVASAAFARTTVGPFLSADEDELEAVVEQVIDYS